MQVESFAIVLVDAARHQVRIEFSPAGRPVEVRYLRGDMTARRLLKGQDAPLLDALAKVLRGKESQFCNDAQWNLVLARIYALEYFSQNQHPAECTAQARPG